MPLRGCARRSVDRPALPGAEPSAAGRSAKLAATARAGVSGREKRDDQDARPSRGDGPRRCAAGPRGRPGRGGRDHRGRSGGARGDAGGADLGRAAFGDERAVGARTGAAPGSTCGEADPGRAQVGLDDWADDGPCGGAAPATVEGVGVIAGGARLGGDVSQRGGAPARPKSSRTAFVSGLSGADHRRERPRRSAGLRAACTGSRGLGAGATQSTAAIWKRRTRPCRVRGRRRSGPGGRGRAGRASGAWSPQPSRSPSRLRASCIRRLRS